ncbi:hypothetical protein [Andreprevotia chitinilytica]|uniref:hypothetical protein n=1 Tax=Andreprevotia chitinilytica TaxID=396808 RepID=UPI00054D71E0|nr:hypothetical protein [Andreprevotia chitinilytica]
MNTDLINSTAMLIQRYLANRPDAADTLEGIHMWWVDWPRSPECMSVTLAALEQLEADGFVERVRIAGNELWRRPRGD